MKKGLLTTLLVVTLLMLGSSCKKDKSNKECNLPQFKCYKGRLEIKGMCGNYSIKVLSEDINPNLFQTQWQNPRTGETHTNVFALKNSCDFPSSINEGDEFYFRIISAAEKNCGVCTGYYPTPDKAHFIDVLDTPCYKTTN